MNTPVPGPKRKAEHSIFFVTNQASKGWNGLLATRRNDPIEAREFLTSTPLRRTPLNYQLKEELALLHRDEPDHVRWQLKL